MNVEFLSYAAGFIITFLMSFILAIYAFKKRSLKLHTFFILVMFSICIWSLGSLMELVSPLISNKILWAKISWIGITTVSPFLFLFVLSYGKYDKYLKNSYILILLILPLILTILAFTNQFHHLIWTSIIPYSTTIGTILVYNHGLALWINALYSYSLLLISISLMTYILFNSPKIYKFQAALVLIGIACPFIVNIIYLSKNLTFLIDLTPMAFCITSLLAALAIFKYKFLNILPVAHYNLFNNMSNGFMVFDAEDCLIEMNKSAQKMFYLTSDHIGKKFNDIFKNEEQLKTLYFNLNKEDYEILINENQWTDVKITPLYEDLGVSCGKLIIITDINKKKSYEAALEEKQRTLETLISNLPGVAYKCRNDKDWTMEFISEGCLELTGYPVEYLLMNKKLSFNNLIHPDDREYVWNKIQKCLNENKPFKIIYRIKTADSKEKYVWEQGRIIYSNPDKLPMLEGFITDITDSIKAEEMLKKSLKEKNILLQEIHHRVKNNMQIISSLLNLQSRYVENEGTLNLLKESQGRIKAMALVHEKLYQSESLESINFSEYVKSLINELYSSYRINKNLLNIEMDIEDIFLDINEAIPCSLIINELISNILKHAFPFNYIGKPSNNTFSSPSVNSKSVNDSFSYKGNIYIGFSKKENLYELIISDDGVGLPPELDLNNTKTLGLQLVNALVNQLEGTIEVERDAGTKFIINFKEQKTELD